MDIKQLHREKLFYIIAICCVMIFEQWIAWQDVHQAVQIEDNIIAIHKEHDAKHPHSRHEHRELELFHEMHNITEHKFWGLIGFNIFYCGIGFLLCYRVFRPLSKARMGPDNKEGMINKLGISFKLWTVFVFMIGVVLLLGISSHINTQKLEGTVQTTMHYQQTTRTLEDVLAMMKDAETGQRGYLLTGKEKYLEPFHNAKKELEGHVYRLNKLHEELEGHVYRLNKLHDDDQPHRKMIKRIEFLVHKKFEELQETITLRREKGVESALKVVNTDVGKKFMDEIRYIIKVMITEEDVLLAVKVRETNQYKKNAELLTTYSSLFVIIVLIISAILLTKNITIPIREMVTRVDRISTDTPTYEVMNDKRKDEIGVLDNTLFKMTQTVKEANDGLTYAKREADRANHLKSVFLANMSHEIRTPLNGIVGLADLVTLKVTGQEKEFMGIIKDCSIHLADLINDIIDISKIEAGVQTYNKTYFCIKDTVTMCVNTLRPLAVKKGLSINMNTTCSALCKGNEFHSDEVKIKQVIINLINNAIKYTDSGEITVSHKKENSRHVITVTDPGRGIPKEFQPKVFDIFQQSDVLNEGSGIGLALCRRITEGLDGEISFTSEEGKGSEFTISFPVGNVVHDPSTKEEGFVLPEGVKTLLIAEDNAVNTLVLKSMLEQRGGLEIDTVVNGQEAIDKALNKDYDVIFMDIKMPKVSGDEAMKVIKEKKDTTIIALTANAMNDDRQLYMDMGFDWYIPKPMKKEVLDNIFQNNT